VPPGSCGSGPSSPTNEWPLQKERSKLLSLAAEQELLRRENRSLNLEVARMRRQARTELRLRKLETMAMRMERDEMSQLMQEAQRLINMKEKLECKAIFEGAEQQPEELSKQEKKLAEEHAAALEKAATVCTCTSVAPTPAPQSLIGTPRVPSVAPITPRRTCIGDSHVTPRELIHSENVLLSMPPLNPSLRRPHRSRTVSGTRLTSKTSCGSDL